MTKRIAWTLVLGLAGLLVVGCDDGEPPMEDAGPMQDLPPPIEAYTEGGSSFETATLDLSCRGSRTAPTGGADVDVTFELRDFQDEFEVPDIEVHLFRDNVITDGCSAPGCQGFTTDDMGNASVTLPANGWYAYRVLPFEDPGSRMRSVFQVFQYNEPAPAASGSSVEGVSVSGITIDLIPALLGFTRENGRAILSGRIHDCNDANIANARIRAYDPDGNFIEPTGRAEDAADYYFSGVVMGNVPDQLATESRPDGLYVVPQVEYIDDRPYRVEAWANVDGELTRVGCETARIFTDSVTVINIGPERADGAPECM